ncbi:MAG TPA: hypothetical protein DCQ30_16860, partial [Acidimicrobiaceae bacterium]|nr:hypothetical protein [Acidimicrobiaceae bacterium]
GGWGAGTVEASGADSSAPSAIDEGGGPPTVFVQAPDGSVLNYSYDNGNWMEGPPPDAPVFVPSGSPYLTLSATMTENGSGTGYSAYIVAHDNDLDALAVGIQSDTTAPQSNGQPYFIWELVQDGVFSYQYLGPASNHPTPVTLAWWPGAETAVFYEGNTPIADVAVTLVPQLLFSIEGDARQDGDSLNDTFTNTQIAVGDDCPTSCGLTGTWTTQFHYFGLQATQTNSAAQNGADFKVTGTVSGLGPGDNWGNNEIAGIAMISQNWNGQ